MKTKKIFLPVIAFVLLATTACEKYPEGPNMSLRSRSERVANTWKAAKVTDGNSDVTSDYDQYELDLTKSGGATLTAKYNFFGETFEITTEGTWSFMEKDTKIALDFENNDADNVYRIDKLEEEEMWLREDGGTVEFHFVPK